MPSRSPMILANNISKFLWISFRLFLIKSSDRFVLSFKPSSSPPPPIWLHPLSVCNVMSFRLVSDARCCSWNASSKNSVCLCVRNSELRVGSHGSLACCRKQQRMPTFIYSFINRDDSHSFLWHPSIYHSQTTLIKYIDKTQKYHSLA